MGSANETIRSWHRARRWWKGGEERGMGKERQKVGRNNNLSRDRFLDSILSLWGKSLVEDNKIFFLTFVLWF